MPLNQSGEAEPSFFIAQLKSGGKPKPYQKFGFSMYLL